MRASSLGEMICCPVAPAAAEDDRAAAAGFGDGCLLLLYLSVRSRINLCDKSFNCNTHNMYVQQESNVEQCTAKKLENGNLPNIFGI